MKIEESFQKIVSRVPESFRQGIRVQMLIDRRNPNTNGGSCRWVNKLVSSDAVSYDKNVHKLLHQLLYLKSRGLDSIRLYQSINDRNATKAIAKMMNLMTETLLNKNEPTELISRFNDKFISCLMKPECRKSKLMLIDYDSKDSGKFEIELHKAAGRDVFKYETKNGFHFIMPSFDIRALNDFKFDLHRDGLMLLYW